MSPTEGMRIGVISDTHGRLRRRVFDVFAGVEHILHAGDIGPFEIIADLQAIAPVTAVWGNTDDFEIRARVPEIASLELAGRSIVVMHGHQVGAPTPERLRAAQPDADIIVYGHTHRPLEDRNGASLVLNPGGAGAPRFGIGVSAAVLTLLPDDVIIEFVPLDDED